jgi:cytochrome c oxidase subunit I
MIWGVLMVVNMTAWKRDNPGRPVPLAMFAITATALLWAWAAAGVLIELPVYCCRERLAGAI